MNSGKEITLTFGALLTLFVFCLGVSGLHDNVDTTPNLSDPTPTTKQVSIDVIISIAELAKQ